MLTRTIAAATLVLGLGQAALADDASSNMSSYTSTATNPDNLPQELRQKLQEAGYKNIEIIPGSYLVNAQDSQGNNVLMRIGPTSMTVLTEAATSTTGSSNGSNNNSSQSDLSGNSSDKSGGNGNDTGSTK